MRARLAFGLTAFTFLFLLQGLNALFAVLFALVYNSIFPDFQPGWLVLAIVPSLALLAPALPFSLWFDRASIIVWASITAAAARVLLCLPDFPLRYVASALVVASGALFLGKIVGFAERRSVAAGAATAFVADQLLRLAGWSYDVSLRPSWMPVQLALAIVVAVIAIWWRRQPNGHEAPNASLERRAGGVRLRGAVALGCILFLESAILSRPEVVYRWIEVPYELAAVVLICAGGLAVLLVLGVPGPIGHQRPVALGLIAAMLLGALARALPGGRPLLQLLLFAAGHAGGLLLLDRALQPAGGRRRGWRLAAGMATLLILNASWAFTFYHAFTVPLFAGMMEEIVVGCALLLAAALTLMPRPSAVATRPRPLPAAGALVLLAIVAFALALRPLVQPAVRTNAGVRVATYNIHYGFDERWRYDPERIARTIEESAAVVVALQEVSAGVPTAYGTDLALWLERRLGLRALFVPSINGLQGDAILTGSPARLFAAAPLPPRNADRKRLARADLDAADGTMTVFAVHFGVTGAEQRAQLDAAMSTLLAPARAVFMGDLNAGPDSYVARTLRAAGFRDAFELSGIVGPPTWPASMPVQRIDWIWVRGYGVRDPLTSRGGGSDHLLVAATVRPR